MLSHSFTIISCMGEFFHSFTKRIHGIDINNIVSNSNTISKIPASYIYTYTASFFFSLLLTIYLKSLILNSFVIMFTVSVTHTYVLSQFKS